jgi:Outer membrane protein beta-barrel domain
MRRGIGIAFILCLVLVFAFAGVADAKKGKNKKNKKKKVESSDPYAGRFGIGFSLGGSSGSGGTGFHGGIGLSYYFIKYVSAHASVGYGFTPYSWVDSDGDTETVKVNYVPADISVLFHLMPGNRISPYFGPGVGLTYTWYDFDGEEFEETWYNAFVAAGVTYWVANNFGLNMGIRYTVPYYDDEWQTDDGQLTYGMSGSLVF